MKIQIGFGIILALFVGACASSTPTPTRAPAFAPSALVTVPAGASMPALAGKFVFALGDGSLWLQVANAKEARLIFDPKDGTYADFPAFSPDGKQIAFSTSSVKPDGLFQYDIRLIDADGSNPRILAVPDNAKAIFVHPAWSPDGKEIYFTQTYPVPPTGDHSEIDRVGVNGGRYVRALDDAREVEVSSDGKKIAYHKLDAQTFASSLWVADLNGGNAKLIVDTQTFSAISGARFSPDSKTLLFTASGAPKKKLPGVTQLLSPQNESFRYTRNDRGCVVEFLFMCWVARAAAHGLPWDLWLANVDGSKITQLTQMGADSPSPAWSSDGKLIAFFEATGIYVLDAQKKIVFPVTNRGGYGGFDWR